jgi:hypothetical protein
MPLLLEQRAATILYHFLVSNPNPRPILIPANICPIVPLTFMKAQQSFELVDISSDSLCMDHTAALKMLSSGKFSGVLFARTYGIQAPVEDFFSDVKLIDSNLIAIDDRCLCPPVFEDIETVADLVLFSTGYAKIADIGFGGYGWIKPNMNYRQQLLNFSSNDLAGQEQNYKKAIAEMSSFTYVDSNWLNTREMTIHFDAYMALVQEELRMSLAHKALLNSLYSKYLPKDIQLPAEYQTWRFNIKVPDRDKLVKCIFDSGLFASTHFASLGQVMGAAECPNASELHENIINLFNDFNCSLQDAERLVGIVNEHLRMVGRL